MTKVLVRLFALLGVFTLVAIAWAQEPGGFDISTFPDWGENYLMFSGAIFALTGIVRTLPWGQWIDGKFEVLSVAVILGAVVGVVVAYTVQITVDPFASITPPVLAGLAYGAAAGAQNFIAVNILDFGVQRVSKPIGSAVATAVRDPSLPQS